MATDRTYTKKATGQRMTLGELRQFVKDCDELGAAESSTIDGRVAIRGGVRELTVGIVRFGDVLDVSPVARRLSGSA